MMFAMQRVSVPLPWREAFRPLPTRLPPSWPTLNTNHGLVTQHYLNTIKIRPPPCYTGFGKEWPYFAGQPDVGRGPRGPPVKSRGKHSCTGGNPRLKLLSA